VNLVFCHRILELQIKFCWLFNEIFSHVYYTQKWDLK
jgi:hypothetical protein